MFEASVVPLLSQGGGGRRLRRRVVKVTGRSESQVEEIAHPIYSRIGDDHGPVGTTILAMPGQIELHLTAIGADAGRLGRMLDEAVSGLARRLGRRVFSADGRSLEAVVGDLLRERSCESRSPSRARVGS